MTGSPVVDFFFEFARDEASEEGFVNGGAELGEPEALVLVGEEVGVDSLRVVAVGVGGEEGAGVGDVFVEPVDGAGAGAGTGGGDAGHGLVIQDRVGSR